MPFGGSSEKRVRKKGILGRGLDTASGRHQGAPTFGGISPGERDERLAGIMARAKVAGRSPRDPLAAAQATLSRNLAREQSQARAAIERTNAKIDAAKASARTSALEEHGQGERNTTRIVTAINGLSIPAPTVSVDITARSADLARTRYFRVNNRPPGTGPTID